MIYLLKFWKELVIVLLLFSVFWLINLNQTAKYRANEIELIHSKLIAEAEAKSAKAIAEYQALRQEDVEAYAKQVNAINSKYASLLSDSHRLQSKIETYNTRLHTVTRETVESYAKTAATVYADCRGEYLKMGQYAAQLDAELDKVTRSQ